jgi:hypothetical protein
MNRVLCIAALLSIHLMLSACTKLHTPSAFSARTQSPVETQAVNQQLFDNALVEAISQLDLGDARGRTVFVNVASEYTLGHENVRAAISEALARSGANGIASNTADADMLLTVTPYVYDGQIDHYNYTGLFYSKLAVRQTATVELRALATDMNAHTILSASKGEAYATLEVNRIKYFWIFPRGVGQRTFTYSGGALESLSAR